MSHIFDVFSDGPTKQVESCEGLYINLSDGQRLLDMSAGDTSHMILGWGHPRVLDAMQAQMNKFTHLDYKAWRDPNLYELSDILCRGGKSGLDAVYYCGNAGAEACEAAMKMSYQVHQAHGHTKKLKFIGRQQSYHGSSTDAMSLTDRPNLLVHKPFFPDNKLFVPEHNPIRHRQQHETDQSYVERCLADIERCIVENDPDTIAGFIGETMMGGLVGDVPPLPGYWSGIKQLCDKYQIHLILDEVYCGTATSGKYHCYEYDDVVPDFLMVSKTLAAGYAPLSAVITHDSYQQAIHEHFGGRLAHSTTMQAYSLGVAAALAVQKEVSQPAFLDEVFEKGQWLTGVFQSELGHLSSFREVRGRGLRMSVEHKVDDNMAMSEHIYAHMMSRGINLNCKWHRCSFTPALNVSSSQLSQVAETFVEAFTLADQVYSD